ncbi:hypothetical protein RHMOL_Rhmol13G0306200 [Rhododendron molle]|uniref:Uncharacterized protein n=1 Tax=Rhododendron molle TaxID=49168 RepID=A0ACC0LCH6_RHOML|nr:hypothetical protein RHMOL_Rhmol13G0306200 [Rhododendron molle]
MTALEDESQITLSQVQQSELVEFQESKPNKELSEEELDMEALKKKDLNWKRACLWSAGQQNEDEIKEMMKINTRSVLG